MALTVLVRSSASETVRLTFDGTQRVVIGRGAGSDVRLPDPSVSHRHATLQAQGADFVVVDEGSTNGTFVGDVRVAPRTSRIVRSGDMVRVGRLWLELRVEPGAVVTRDLAVLTRDLALALVSQELAALGEDLTMKVRVVEGKDQGVVLPLREEGRPYLIGRAPNCDLPLTDQDASREHVRLAMLDGVVSVQDLGAKNGTWIGEARAPGDRAVPWRPTSMIKIGRTVLALEEPVGDALARIENAPDSPLAPDLAPGPPPAAAAPPSPRSVPALPADVPPTQAPGAASAAAPSKAAALAPRWSASDRVVMVAAFGLLVLSLAGLVWLLRG
jgi:pSer/pThr/pTyr-binding forkhead associated (FHA) protein